MRLGSALESFGRLATGAEGAPRRPARADPEILGQDRRCLDYADVRARNAGPFNEHFVASLPYSIEEQCRMGSALLDHGLALAGRRGGHADFYFLGDGPGLTGRTVAECSAGRIRTLTCSPNSENRVEFDRRRADEAHFFHGSFLDVSPATLAERDGLAGFAGGFDLIFEDTTFQMYGKERREPILLARRNLRPGGIFLFLEKFAHEDSQEFLRRERQKDEGFKARFFDAEQIVQKRTRIVQGMDSQLVTLEEMGAVLSQLFSHAVVIWNSGNFHTIAASDSPDALNELVGRLVPPAIPATFQYVELPLALTGVWQETPRFRAHAH